MKWQHHPGEQERVGRGAPEESTGKRLPERREEKNMRRRQRKRERERFLKKIPEDSWGVGEDSWGLVIMSLPAPLLLRSSLPACHTVGPVSLPGVPVCKHSSLAARTAAEPRIGTVSVQGATHSG